MCENNAVELEQGTVNVWDPVAREGVDVPGHRYDVREERLPLDLGDGRILLESNFRTDPVEGTHGTYTVRDVNEECPECGLAGGMDTTVHTLVGEHREHCDLCDANIDPR